MEGQVYINIEKTDDNIYHLRLLTAKILDELQIRNIEKQICSLIEAGAKKMVLDFTNVDYLSSSALGMLITVKKRLAENKGEIKLCAIKDKIFEVFKLTGLNKLFEIYDTSTEAINSFSK